MSSDKSPCDMMRILYKHGHLVYLEVELSKDLDEIIDWCIDNFGLAEDRGRWETHTTNVRGYVWFRNIDDITLFKLTWL